MPKSILIDMGCSKNTLNKTLKTMDRLDKLIISVLIIVTILICVFLDVPFQERRRPIFLEGFWTHTTRNWFNNWSSHTIEVARGVSRRYFLFSVHKLDCE
jgi:hypothetical protein